MDPTTPERTADPNPEPGAARGRPLRPGREQRARDPPPRQALAPPTARGPPPEAPMLDVAGAMAEILHVPAASIHRAAAYAWASRAIAGYRVCAGHEILQNGLTYLYLGEHYREAALAHASMGEAWQPLYAEIDQAMAADRAEAFASMRQRSAEAGR